MKTLTPQLIGPIVLENLRFRFLIYQLKLKHLLSIITVKIKRHNLFINALYVINQKGK